jgi:hypothetical protein
MAALITEAFYTARYGTGNSAQITAFIADVSAEIVDYVNTLDTDSVNPIDADDWDETNAPAAIQAVVARVVNRAIGNPLGISQEGLGDHQRSFSVGMSGGMMSPKDKRIIRRAAGASGGQNLGMEGYLPLEPGPLEADISL